MPGPFTMPPLQPRARRGPWRGSQPRRHRRAWRAVNGAGWIWNIGFGQCSPTLSSHRLCLLPSAPLSAPAWVRVSAQAWAPGPLVQAPVQVLAKEPVSLVLPRCYVPQKDEPLPANEPHSRAGLSKPVRLCRRVLPRADGSACHPRFSGHAERRVLRSSSSSCPWHLDVRNADVDPSIGRSSLSCQILLPDRASGPL